MRAWLALFRTGFLALFFGASAMAAPPPPPPPRPSETPPVVDGFETHAVWTSYSSWVRKQIGAARSLVLEIAPAPKSLGAEYARWNDGPRMRAYLPEALGELYGIDIRIDRWRRSRAPAAPDCTWVARMATSRGGSDLAFVRTSTWNAR